MRLNEFQKAEAADILHCPNRALCPVGMVCGRESGPGKVLFPAIVPFEAKNLLWTDLHYDQHVFVVRDGVLTSMAHLHNEDEVPFALFGAGIGIGIADLYIPREDVNIYHMRGLIPGHICSLPSKALRRNLEDFPSDVPLKMMATSLYNQAGASLIQSILSSRPLLADRVAMLIIALVVIAQRGKRKETQINLTHGEIAELVHADRAAVTRVLCQLETDGFLKRGYRTIIAQPPLFRNYEEWVGTCQRFYTVQAEGPLSPPPSV